MRIGIIGYGYVGSYLYNEIVEHPEWGVEVAFVWPGRSNLARLPSEIQLDDLASAPARGADLIVEAAHAEVTREHGVNLLKSADYMPLSTTALADAPLETELLDVARSNRTCLYIPHGAAVGLESLAECRDLWEDVTVTTRKNPKNLDFTESGDLAASPRDREMVLYDGPTRGVCKLFPRNVNAHAATAIAGIGFDRTHSVLVSDPALEVSVIELTARGADVSMHVTRSNPLKGVSGVMTLRSILGSVQRTEAPGIHLKVV